MPDLSSNTEHLKEEVGTKVGQRLNTFATTFASMELFFAFLQRPLIS